jgi:hypothetical protein
MQYSNKALFNYIDSYKHLNNKIQKKKITKTTQ